MDDDVPEVYFGEEYAFVIREPGRKHGRRVVGVPVRMEDDGNVMILRTADDVQPHSTVVRLIGPTGVDKP